MQKCSGNNYGNDCLLKETCKRYEQDLEYGNPFFYNGFNGCDDYININ